MRRNQALTFVKPHAVRSRMVRACIRDIFADHGIETLHELTVDAERIRADGLIDRHYAANARRGTFESAPALELPDSAREIFRTAFDEDWDAAVLAGRVFSGEALRAKLGGISGEELNALWARHGACKLSSGCYAARFDEHGCYVVNGFYPSIREQFTRPGAAIHLVLVAFDLSWAEFRRCVIGSTNPAAAEDGSIRGHVYDHADTLGLTVDARDNVIHASASPFEALCETLIWLPDWPRSREPLWKRLHQQAGLAPGALVERMLALHATNPIVTLPDYVGPLLDGLEDRDTAEVAADLLFLLNPP